MIAAAIGLVYRREGRTARPVYKVLLGALRLFLFLLALIVFVPQLQLRIERQGWPDLAVVIDVSRSMSHTDSFQDPALRDAVEQLREHASLPVPQRLELVKALLTRHAGAEHKDWLDGLLAHKFKVHLYCCAKGRTWLADVTEPSQKEDALKAVAQLRAEVETSELGASVTQVLDDFGGRPLAAVVMFTDGVTTAGEDLAKVAARRRGVPLYLIGIGDARKSAISNYTICRPSAASMSMIASSLKPG